MRFTEIICEKTIQLPQGNGELYIVFKNPTRSQFLKLTASENTDLKGLIAGKDLYLWPAWNAHHHEVAHALGLGDAIRFFVHHNGITVHDAYDDIVLNNPQIKYLYGESGPTLYSEIG